MPMIFWHRCLRHVALRSTRTNAESEYLTLGSHASGAIARAASRKLHRKMKRESRHESRRQKICTTRSGSALACKHKQNPMNHLRSAHTLRRLVLLFAGSGLISVTGLQPAIAAEPEPLDPIVIAATRTPQSLTKLGSVVDVLTPDDISRQQFGSLRDALGSLALPIFASGAQGAGTSLFMRGANSNQTLFLVDGIRANDPNTDYQIFLGGAAACACDSLEVAHGPQSTLYGGEAMGGVISLRAQKGEGSPSGKVSGEFGSFGTFQGAVASQGASGPWAYNVSAAGGHTDNDRANNKFDSGTFAFRLDRTVTNSLALGATLRGFHGYYGDPGDRYTNDPDNHDEENSLLGTLFADAKLADDLTSHVTLGGQDRRFEAISPTPGRSTQITVIKNRRAVLDWQATYTGIETHRATAGIDTEAETTRNTGFGDINKKQTLFAVFAEDEWTPLKNVFLTGGLRYDDFDTFGSATTGRATAAWRVLSNVKIRGSYSTGFRSPSFLDLYGKSAFYVGNPNLKPERAEGGDAGIDYTLPDQYGTVSATWFQTDYRDLIVGDFSKLPGTEANVLKARTQGVEFSATNTWPAEIKTRVSYTYLDAKNLSTGGRLLRRPRHAFSADVWHDFGHGISAGAGVHLIAKRKDIDAKTFATV